MVIVMVKKLKRPSNFLLAYMRRWFLAGLLITVPAIFTFYAIWLVVNVIDDQVAKLLPPYLFPQYYIDFPLPGFGLIISVVIIMIIGAITTGIIGRGLVRFSERLVESIPVIRSIYGAVKQIMETVMKSQSDAFREVVLIEYPRKEVWVIGFVTGSTRGEVQNISAENLINVFVPTTPNPTSGFLLFLPREDVIVLDMGVEAAVKMVVSGGIVTPEDARKKRMKKPLAKVGAKKKKAIKKKAAKN